MHPIDLAHETNTQIESSLEQELHSPEERVEFLEELIPLIEAHLDDARLEVHQ